MGQGRQRMLVNGTRSQVLMEQVYREYEITDVDDAIEALLNHYGNNGQNVLEAVCVKLVSRALEKSTMQKDAARLLGMSPRMMNYYVNQWEPLKICASVVEDDT